MGLVKDQDKFCDAPGTVNSDETMTPAEFPEAVDTVSGRSSKPKKKSPKCNGNGCCIKVTTDRVEKSRNGKDAQKRSRQQRCEKANDLMEQVLKDIEHCNGGNKQDARALRRSLVKDQEKFCDAPGTENSDETMTPAEFPEAVDTVSGRSSKPKRKKSPRGGKKPSCNGNGCCI